MHRPLLSINIVSYNTKDITLACLRSIKKSLDLSWPTKSPQSDLEIVVVDNHSSDGSAEAITQVAAELSLPLRVIAMNENVGFGRGHNRAAAESNGEYLLLLNTDTVLLKDALAMLLTTFIAQNPPLFEEYLHLLPKRKSEYRVHFAGPQLLNSNLSPQPSCGPYYSIPVIFAALFLKGDYWGLTRYSPNQARQVDWVSGACIICKKTDFDELGGFDADIFMYMEEIELFKRASKKGMQVWYLPQAQIVHLGSASSNKTYPILQVFRGFLYLYSKHHSKLELRMVQWLLTTKARLAIGVATLLRKTQTVKTYSNALSIVNN